jgi:class 3 adenylate cyclase/tetratricopeptide (TPR) repeat protein
MPTCLNCGEENPDRAKFCLSCGTALAEAPSRRAEERKVVSILFVDLVGFTARSDRADPEDVRATLRPYHARLKREIEHFGGTVEKFIGDAVMAVFGAPIAHEDDAERAVRSGLRILEAIEDLNAAEGVELAVRGGVATGEAVVSLDARPEMGEGIATGDVVNTAARLQQSAPVGAVVVGASTFRATRDVILYEELDAVTVKGKSEPLSIWRATRPRGRFGVDVERRADVPFVGRQHELTLLKGAYVRALDESSLQLVTMTGEPGVGKTRLIAEFQRFVDDRPEIVWWRQGRCLPYGEGITFWALGEFVKAHAGILESDGPEEVNAKLAAAINSLVGDESDREWFRTRLEPLVGAEAAGPAIAREELFSAWQRFLELIAAQRPLVLVIEDLHWADAALVDFLEHLVDWASGVPLVLLIAARPELYERHPGWGGGKRNSVTISLGPLSNEETARLVGSLVGRSVLPAEMQSALLERAGGNPLYAEEFVRMLAERGAPDPATPLPETVQALIAARLDTLPPERKSLLQDAAVVGKVFWTGAVAAIGNVDERIVKDGMRELLRKELVRPARTSSVEGQEELAFWHVLVRDVAYQQIPRAGRAEKHSATSEWIEQLAGDRAADHAEILVHHSQQALDLARASGSSELEPLEDRLRRFLLLAGERASRLDAQQASEYFARAVTITPPEHPNRADVLDRAGEAAWAADHTDDAIAWNEEALEGYRGKGDVQGAGRAMSLLSHLYWVNGRDGADKMLDDAIALLESEPPGPDLLRAYGRDAGRHMLSGRTRESLAAADKAIELSKRLGLSDEALFARQVRGVALCELEGEPGLNALRDALDRALESGRGMVISVAYNNLGHFRWLVESPRAGLETKREGMAFDERRGLLGSARWTQMETMWILFDLGEWDEVLAVGSELEELAGEAGLQGQLRASVPTFRTLVLAQRGYGVEPGEADGFLSPARQIGDPQVLVPALAAGAIWAHARGDAADAIALIEELEEFTRDPGNRPDWSRLLEAAPALRICVELGRLDLGERFLDRPDARGARLEHANVACRAIVAEARGETDEAAALYAEAARRWQDYEFPFERAHALLGHWRCTEDPESLREAQAIFDRLGAVVPQATAEEPPRAARRAK